MTVRLTRFEPFFSKHQPGGSVILDRIQLAIKDAIGSIEDNLARINRLIGGGAPGGGSLLLIPTQVVFGGPTGLIAQSQDVTVIDGPSYPQLIAPRNSLDNRPTSDLIFPPIAFLGARNTGLGIGGGDTMDFYHQGGQNFGPGLARGPNIRFGYQDIQIIPAPATVTLGGGTALVRGNGNGSLTLIGAGTIGVNGAVVIGEDGALLTTASSPHLQINSCAGVPTAALGAAAHTGKIAIVYDSTNERLYNRNLADTFWRPIGQYTGGLATGFLVSTNGTGIWTTDATTYVPATRTVQGTTPILIDGGTAAVDLSANRVWSHAASGVAAGSYANANITVDAGGHVTAAASGGAGTIYYQTVANNNVNENQRARLDFTPNFDLTDDGAALPLGNRTIVDLSQPPGVAGSYTSMDATVDAYGRITAAANGGGGGVPSTRIIATSPPLVGGGDLSADRTLALSFDGITINLNGLNEIERRALTGDITAAAGSNATAFRSFSARSVLARAAATGGVPTELSASADDQVLQRAAGVLTFAQLAYSQLSGAPTLYYQTIQENGTPQTQRGAFNFSPNFDISDDGAGNRTMIDLSQTGVAGAAYAPPASVTVDAYGRITAISALSFTNGSVMFWSSGFDTDPTRFFYDSVVHEFQMISTSATAGAQAFYNVKSADYERFRFYWDTNTLHFDSEKGGAGTKRNFISNVPTVRHEGTGDFVIEYATTAQLNAATGSTFVQFQASTTEATIYANLVARASGAGAVCDAIVLDVNDVNITGTTTIATATGFNTVNIKRANYITPDAGVTVTNAATVYIDNAPLAGTNVTITNPYALWVDAGATRLDGDLVLPTTANGATLVGLGVFGPTGASATPQFWVTMKTVGGTVGYIPVF